uniref:UNC93-like protein MFSD11 n=1 Tax=Strigamia maritima TaxID=126957 RepID=T1J1U8_STRMM
MKSSGNGCPPVLRCVFSTQISPVMGLCMFRGRTLRRISSKSNAPSGWVVKTSSPTTASAIAFLISRSGVVNVSLLNSISHLALILRIDLDLPVNANNVHRIRENILYTRSLSNGTLTSSRRRKKGQRHRLRFDRSVFTFYRQRSDPIRSDVYHSRRTAGTSCNYFEMGLQDGLNELWNKHAENVNIFILGISFMVFYTGFLPTNSIAPIVLSSVKNENSSFVGDGYTRSDISDIHLQPNSVSITYIVLAVANGLASSVVAVIGPKYAIILGFSLLCMNFSTYTASFLHVAAWSLYLTSFFVGFGGACIWAGHGKLITVNSDESNISRNSGIFWAMFESSLLISNLVVYFDFRRLIRDSQSRTSTLTTLLTVSVVGILPLLFLKMPVKKKTKTTRKESHLEVGGVKIAWRSLDGTIRIFFTKQMLVLCITFLFTGFELAFFSSVYATWPEMTRKFDSNATNVSNVTGPWTGLNGAFVGVGEITGSVVFGVLAKWTLTFGRDVAFTCGYVVHLVSYYLIFLNRPDESPSPSPSPSSSSSSVDGTEFNDCTRVAANLSIAMLCSLLLGFGDGCFNPQIISLIGSLYADDCVPAFAIYKFTQSFASAVTMFYSRRLDLRLQLLLLVVSGAFGLAAFCWAEWRLKRLSRSFAARGVYLTSDIWFWYRSSGIRHFAIPPHETRLSRKAVLAARVF